MGEDISDIYLKINKKDDPATRTIKSVTITSTPLREEEQRDLHQFSVRPVHFKFLPRGGAESKVWSFIL
jgi:hypothetical protein